MKTVLITGAGSGIGLSTARAFSQEGYEVFLLGRNSKKIETAVNSIRETGKIATGLTADVSDTKNLHSILDETFKEKSLDVLINNASVIQPIAEILETDSEEWLTTLKINVFGNYLCSKFALKKMLNAGKGTILNVSSGAAHGPMEGWSAYCTSKAAAAMFTRAVHREYKERGIRAFGLRPGVVDTDMQGEIRASGINSVSKLKRSDLISPEIPAKAICWLVDKGDEFLGTEVDIRDTEFQNKSGVFLN